MDVDQPIAQIAAAMAEPARARILCALMDGRAYTATELAAVADTASSTASAHLSRLTDVGLLTKVSQGRHRYFQLADPAVAQVLETMMHLAGVVNRVISVSMPQPLRFARSCYDHLAGTVAVAVLQRWLQLGWLTPIKSEAPELQPDYQLTALGKTSLAAMGLDYQAKAFSRRRYACGCLDWSERTAHLGGQLGALLLDFMLKKKWFSRQLDGRALQLTALGRRQLQHYFQLTIAVE